MTSQSDAPAPFDAPAQPTRKHDRQYLAQSMSAAEVNLVTHPGYTEADRKVAFLKEGEDYITQNLTKKGSLFFIRLSHFEGELDVGLGRRSFDNTVDDPTQDLYEIEWFERKGKKQENWGQTPQFRLTVAGYTSKRRPYPMKSLEPLSAFIPVQVQLAGKATSGEPKISKACMTAVRSSTTGQDSAALVAGNEIDKDEETFEDEAEMCAKQTRKRRLNVIVDDPE